jgi:hypothetical protein
MITAFMVIVLINLTWFYLVMVDPYTDEDGDGLEWSRWKERNEIRPRQ